MSDLNAVFRRPFNSQVAYFRGKLGELVPTRTWQDLERAEHDSAFMVAGAMKADLLADLAASVDKSIAQGRTLEEFRKDFRAIVEKHGWHGWTGEGTPKGEAWRTRVIYQTNMRVSYAAGRYAQLRKFPFWIYRHSGAAHPRLDHLSWDRLVLPSDHEFWRIHYPPNGWGCGCRVVGALSRKIAAKLGGDLDNKLPEGWNVRDPRTGLPPGIGKGWDYAPGASVASEVEAMAGKVRHWDYQVAKGFMADAPESRRDALSASFRSLPSTAVDIRRYAERAIGIRNDAPVTNVEVQKSWTMGLATSRDAARIGELTGVDIGSFDFSLDAAAVVRVLSASGGPAGRNIAAGDIRLLPLILNSPDTIEDAGATTSGAPAVRYVKQVGGETYSAIFAIDAARRTMRLDEFLVGLILR